MKPSRSTPSHLLALAPRHPKHWASIAARCAFAAGVAVLAFAALATAQSAETPASPAAELAQIEARLKQLNPILDAHADLAPLKQAAAEADKAYKAAQKETSARLDPEAKIDALRKEIKGADTERQAEIRALIKQHEQAVTADPALAPLALARDAARKAYIERRKDLAKQVAPELPALEKRRNELRYPKK